MPDHTTKLDHLVGHRFYRYRGCAPSPENPRVSLGDEGVSVFSWGAPTEDGGEPQKARHAREAAAVRVCRGCPVLDACRAYGLAETPEGRLAEPEGIWGGMLALDRHRHVIRSRKTAGVPVPVGGVPPVLTAQKRAILVALARETDEELVAYRAGMDVQKANYQRSILVGMVGLDRETATRQQLLDRARELGLLARSTRVRPDGAWPVAAAPNTEGTRQRRMAPGRPVQLVLVPVELLPPLRPVPGAPGGPGAAGRSRSGRSAPRARAARTRTRPPGASPSSSSARGSGRRLRLARPTPVQLSFAAPASALAVVLGAAA